MTENYLTWFQIVVSAMGGTQEDCQLYQILRPYLDQEIHIFLKYNRI